MYQEDDLLPISALQHLAFCERQCALIHLEQAWAENRLTAEGRVLHDRSHEPETEVRGDVRIARALRLRSLRLGVTGIADVVEFHRIEPLRHGGTGEFPSVSLCLGGVDSFPGVALPDEDGLWRPFPVEHKRGKPKLDVCDEVQLCAQALCLEEMLRCRVPEGALFYGQPRRRQEVSFTVGLRRQTEAYAVRLHDLVSSGRTPPAPYEKKCDSCSLLSVCMPKATGGARSAKRYLSRAVEEATDSPESHRDHER